MTIKQLKAELEAYHDEDLVVVPGWNDTGIVTDIDVQCIAVQPTGQSDGEITRSLEVCDTGKVAAFLNFSS